MKTLAGFTFNPQIAGVSAPDDYTVVSELTQPNSRFHTTFLDRWGSTWIMPKHVFEAAEDPITFEFDPSVGTGPYKLHSYDPAGYWTIWEKREDWDKSPAGILYGEPKPQYIAFQAFANEGAKIVAQLTHELDVADLSAEGLKAALAQGDANRAYQSGYPWVVNNDPALTGLTFNVAKAPYDNPDVRWALLLAIDIAEYVGQAVDGTGTLSPVHITSLGSYPADFIGPMEGWLADFELDLGNGETFKPYDPDAPQRIAEYAKERGYVVPEDAAAQDQAFGLGWYKYAPEEAAKLLAKNGFSKDADGQWLLPDGPPWKTEIVCRSDTSHLSFKNAAAGVQQWKKFGIDAVQLPSDNASSLAQTGEYDVSGEWPGQEPWGAGPDLYRVLDFYNSEYVEPIGTVTAGHTSRWSSPEMDDVAKRLRETDPADSEAVIAVGIDGLKLAVEAMRGIPTFGYIGFVSVAQAWEAGRLFHIDLNAQAFGRYDQDLRFGSVSLKSAFFLVKFLEDVEYGGSRHFDAHAYRTEDYEGVKDFARGCMRTYLILKDRAERWNSDDEIQALLAEINEEDGSVQAFKGSCTPAKAAALKAATLDPVALGARALAYERLDQLTVEVLLGAR